MPDYIEPTLITLSEEGGTTLRDALNDNFTELKTGITGTHADTAETLNAVVGFGRVLDSTDTTEGQPVAGTGLSLRIPDGTRFLINGTLYIAESDTGYVTITGVPANKGDGVYGYLSATESGTLEVKAEHWYETLPTTPPSGLPVLAQVFTSSSGVTSVTYTESNLVYTQAAILALLEAAGSSSGGSGSGGSGSGSVGVSGPSQAAFDALVARVTALENAAEHNVTAVPQESEMMEHRVQRLESHMTHISPEYAGKTTSGIEIPGITGNGEKWANGKTAPTVYAGGNATRNADKRRID